MKTPEDPFTKITGKKIIAWGSVILSKDFLFWL